jgi:hypothetical protein
LKLNQLTKEEFMDTNTTATLQTNENQTTQSERKPFLASKYAEKKKPIKSLSLRPSRSVKKNSSVMPSFIKLK